MRNRVGVEARVIRQRVGAWVKYMKKRRENNEKDILLVVLDYKKNTDYSM